MDSGLAACGRARNDEGLSGFPCIRPSRTQLARDVQKMRRRDRMFADAWRVARYSFRSVSATIQA
jgi:hypothetical protein